jgi:hypothetical protein
MHGTKRSFASMHYTQLSNTVQYTHRICNTDPRDGGVGEGAEFEEGREGDSEAGGRGKWEIHVAKSRIESRSFHSFHR